MFKSERDRQDMLRRALGSEYELQRKVKAAQGILPTVAGLKGAGVLAGIAKLQKSGMLGSIHDAMKAQSIRATTLMALPSPAWMAAVQKTARGLAINEPGANQAHKVLIASSIPDIVKFARTLSSDNASAASLMLTSGWADRFQSLSQSFAGNLIGLQLAAERARLTELAMPGENVGLNAKSSAMIAAEQVLEANRLFHAIGNADTPEQSATLFAAFVSLVAALFQRFGENTVRELREIGAVSLIGLIAGVLTLIELVQPTELSPAETKLHAEIKAEVQTLRATLDKILASNVEAENAYLEGLPRGELKRNATIRQDPHGKAPALMRGGEGMDLAIRERRGQWLLIVYRDSLTDQLSEGWVYAPAVLRYGDPTD